ncbi:hypothetical protein HMPREF9996_00080 [Aggregatibacter actinomycetemcomitans Y4]|nr:hypothetical protein HMPREF9996_00080 [Aggregatibacter actinomycetemcomitans Y4]
MENNTVSIAVPDGARLARRVSKLIKNIRDIDQSAVISFCVFNLQTRTNA